MLRTNSCSGLDSVLENGLQNQPISPVEKSNTLSPRNKLFINVLFTPLKRWPYNAFAVEVVLMEPMRNP